MSDETWPVLDPCAGRRRDAVVRRIGYRQVDHVVLSNQSTAEIQMDIVAIDLDAMVISGQATGVERRNLATAVTTVTGADLTRVSQQSIEHSLQGKMPGVQISQRTGAPGGGNWVKIRGVSTITAGQTTPLYVVDGVIVADTYVSNAQGFVTAGAGSESPPNRITDLDPNDIETIEVLKGPTASAIYGSKASMGVVLITTKRGKAGRVRWSASQGFGTSRLAYRHGHRQWGYDDATRFSATELHSISTRPPSVRSWISTTKNSRSASLRCIRTCPSAPAAARWTRAISSRSRRETKAA